VGDLSRHFDRSEFRCKDGCGWVAVEPLLVRRLEALRTALRKPIRIVSGRRCPVHNVAVHGASRSRHVYGDGADIDPALRVSVDLAKRIGFTGIGVHRSGYVSHVDTRPGSVTVWKY
jgi:zinc D-Ala-D-Ala carboxypeptidase